MSLLTTSETKNEIIKQVSQAQEQLQIISAFCKIPAIELLDNNICNSLNSKKLMVRFLLSDIIQGATDLTLYEYCKSHEWQLYVKFDLHAKTYIFDKKRCILGSSNLTSNGLSLSLYGNYELSCYAEMNDSDISKVNVLFNSAILMTDELYDLMKNEYEKAQTNHVDSHASLKWSEQIRQHFKPTNSVLFTYDFPPVKTPDYTNPSCYDFLDFDHISTKEELRKAFRCSKAFLWLYDIVDNMPDKTCFFGKLTEKLHNVLINDPKPFRKEVKELLANTLGWIKELEINEMIVDVPNHSQRVRIRNN